jgi:hypothetical protein
MNRVLNLILSHQPREELQALLNWWAQYESLENLLVAYGGSRQKFDTLGGLPVPCIFIDDPRLRVADKQREKQSYGGVWRAAANWLMKKSFADFTHVHFVECDHLPLLSGLAELLLADLDREQADVLGHGLYRIDNSSNPFFLYHAADPAFQAFWKRISVRVEARTVLAMLGTGSFWTRKAFLAVAAVPEEIPVYLEVYLPTLAHHLGFRVRDFHERSACVFATAPKWLTLERARQKSAWTVHPIKTLSPVQYPQSNNL